MGFYLRKSVSLGGFRFNFSKSGIGLSTGIKGMRVVIGPKGSYVHAGRNGFYYRRNFSSSQSSATSTLGEKNETSKSRYENYKNNDSCIFCY